MSAIEANDHILGREVDESVREVSVAVDAMTLKDGLYYSVQSGQFLVPCMIICVPFHVLRSANPYTLVGGIIGVAEDRYGLGIVRGQRHDTLQQQLGGQPVTDDSVDIKFAKHYLVFMATGLGKVPYKFVAARFAVEAVSAKSLMEYTCRVLSDLFIIGNFHAKSLTYDAAQENLCELRRFLLAVILTKEYAHPQTASAHSRCNMCA